MAWPAAETCLNPPSQKYRRKWRGSSWKPFMWADRRGVFPHAAGAEAARRTPERPGIYEFAISRTRTSRTKWAREHLAQYSLIRR